MGALLALASAVCYGLADFGGALLSRRASFAAVALIGQAGALVPALAASALVAAPSVGVAALGWGALSGVGTGLGMVFLYRGMGRGELSVVVPVSAVGGVAFPVLAAVAVLGDRPGLLSWLGIAAALPALWLVSRTGGSRAASAPATLDGLVAGAGIGLQYIAVAQAAPSSGIWPIAAGRLVAVLVIAPMALRRRRRLWLPPRFGAAAAANGALAALALVFYLLATREQAVVIAVVLSDLYPVIPVLLGLTVLRERLNWRQGLGVAGAGVAIALLTAG